MGTLSAAERNRMLDAHTGRTTMTANAGFFVKLHVGDPGAAGTSNPATETTRKAVTFGAAASGGAISNTAQIQWTNYPAGDTVTHVSFWDASSGGNFLGSDDLPSSKVMQVGDTLTVASGDVDLTIS